MNNHKPRPYFPNLDGLRFFAFLFVFISHSILFLLDGELYLAQGDLGVSFFFVLSGFLITYLLFHEKEESRGYIKLTHFYARRILRIWPVYFLVIFFCIIISKLNLSHLPYEIHFDNSSWSWYTGFIANFYLIRYTTVSALVAVLWSISVEEQFYFIWPLVLIMIKRKYIPYLLSLIIILASVFRYLHSGDYKQISYSTFSVVSDLAVGSLIGYFAYYIPSFSERIKSYLSRKFIYAIYISLILFIYIKMFPHKFIPDSLISLYTAILPVIFSIIFGLIILEQNYGAHSFYKASKIKIATYLGKISYGLYAYHMIAIALTFSILKTLNVNSRILTTIFSLVFTIIMSHLSFRYIESKILKLKSKVS